MDKIIVDAQAAVKTLDGFAKRLKKEYPETSNIRVNVGLLDFVKGLIMDCRIDAEPVVRCGECKHWHRQTAYCELHSYFHDSDGLCCSPADSPNWTMWDENDYCSDGIRGCADE